MSTATYLVDGMTCAHCIHAVTSELSALDGVTGVDIDLRPGDASEVTVSSRGLLDPALVTQAVDEAGYEVRS